MYEFKDRLKDEHQYEDWESRNKNRKYAPKYLMMLYEDQLQMFKDYKKANINIAELLRLLVDGHTIFLILLKYADDQFKLPNSDQWTNKDFNEFYDFMTQFRKYYALYKETLHGNFTEKK